VSQQERHLFLRCRHWPYHEEFAEPKGEDLFVLSALPTEIIERPSLDTLRAAISGQSFQFFVRHQLHERRHPAT
jgi:hypothetical protein